MRSIVSADNPLLKLIARLQKKPTAYRNEAMILLEGEHLVLEFLASSGTAAFAHVVLSDEATPEQYEALEPLSEITTLVPQRILAALASGTHHAHVFGLVHLASPADLSLTAPTLLLNGVQDAGNVGTMLRTAAAAGFTQVLLDGQCAAAWSPKVLRAAMGAHAHIAVHEQADVQAWLSQTSLNTLCADVHAKRDLYDVKAALPCAWLFGSEGQGVDAALVAATKTQVRIPQQKVESLNVASAAAVCLYESVRQSRQR
jgi:RNA methyltransferase, TrmH family